MYKQHQLDIEAIWLDKAKRLFVTITGVDDCLPDAGGHTIVSIIYPGSKVRKSMTLPTFVENFKFVTGSLIDAKAALAKIL